MILYNQTGTIFTEPSNHHDFAHSKVETHTWGITIANGTGMWMWTWERVRSVACREDR